MHGVFDGHGQGHLGQPFEVDEAGAVGLEADDPLVVENPHKRVDELRVPPPELHRLVDELTGARLEGRQERAREELTLARRKRHEIDAKVAVAGFRTEIMGLRQEFWPSRAEDHNGSAAQGVEERPEHPDPVGPRAMDVFEDQGHRRALRVDLEEATQHSKGDELEGVRVFVDGFGEGRGARTQAQKGPQKV